jgi:hypothetical protein
MISKHYERAYNNVLPTVSTEHVYVLPQKTDFFRKKYVNPSKFRMLHSAKYRGRRTSATKTEQPEIVARRTRHQGQDSQK